MSDEGLMVEHLAVSYGAARVLNDVNLRVGPGEIVGLVGPNGAGKTTTLRAISGLIRTRAGAIRVDGREISGRPDRMAAAGVAHVPEGRGLFGSLTVLQNLRIGAVAIGRDIDETSLAAVLDLFPKLSRYLKTPAGLLSGGEQQMVTISRGLMARPRVLMVDELSLGLAPKVIQEILQALLAESEARRMGLLIVDQNVRALSKVCDRMDLLRGGITVEASDHIEDLARTVYLGDVEA